MDVIHQLPHPALRPYVRCYWEITHSLANDQSLDIPFGCTGRTHLVITLINTIQMTFDGSKPFKTPIGGLCGQLTRPIIKHVRGTTGVIVVDFTPTGLHALWPMPIDELCMAVPAHDMAQVVGPDAKPLIEQLLNTPTAKQRFAVLETYLLRRLARKADPDLRVEAAVCRLQHRPGFTQVHELAKNLNCSERTLNRRFTERVGVSPKMYARMQRFLQTRRWLEQYPGRHWHDLVAAAGYYDQAHLINEFQYFTGNSPRLYGASNRPIHDFMRQE